jgi:hypothetical protein
LNGVSVLSYQWCGRKEVGSVARSIHQLDAISTASRGQSPLRRKTPDQQTTRSVRRVSGLVLTRDSYKARVKVTRCRKPHPEITLSKRHKLEVGTEKMGISSGRNGPTRHRSAKTISEMEIRCELFSCRPGTASLWRSRISTSWNCKTDADIDAYRSRLSALPPTGILR